MDFLWTWSKTTLRRKNWTVLLHKRRMFSIWFLWGVSRPKSPGAQRKIYSQEKGKIKCIRPLTVTRTYPLYTHTHTSTVCGARALKIFCVNIFYIILANMLEWIYGIFTFLYSNKVRVLRTSLEQIYYIFYTIEYNVQEHERVHRRANHVKAYQPISVKRFVLFLSRYDVNYSTIN